METKKEKRRKWKRKIKKKVEAKTKIIKKWKWSTKYEKPK